MGVAHTLSTELGVFADFNPAVPEAYRDAPFLFLANVTPEIQLRVFKQMRNPRFTLLDTMNFWIASKKAALKKVLRNVTGAVLNDQEIRQLTGEHSLVKAAAATLKMGPKFVLLKRGEHGATIIGKNIHFSLPAYPTAKVKDPTGAGDSFAGGFMGSLARAGAVTPKSLRAAMAVGTVMASFNVEDFSVNKTRRLSKDGINKRLSALKTMIRI
jgi:ribokinase